MTLKQISLSLMLLCSLSSVYAQVSKTFYVSKAGTLIALMTEEEAHSVTDLTLTGNLNAEDFRHLRDEFESLRSLDISNADIKLYMGKSGTYPNEKFHVYKPNVIPAYAFTTLTNGIIKGKKGLEEIVLSEKTKGIDEAAFLGCEHLKVCQIRRKTPPTLSADALSDSITAVFIPRGSSDAYRLAKGWTNFAFIESEPVTATLQVGLMGTLEEEVLKAGLQPNNINFLTVEGKLDEADFKLIRNYMPHLVMLDLTRTTATHIPEFTFAQKRFLLTIHLPKNLKVIGQRTFSGCIRLSGNLVLPPSVTAIEYGAFMGCENLKQVIATGNSITTIGEQLFGDEPMSKLVYKK